MMPYSQEEISSPEKFKAVKTHQQCRREKLLGTVRVMANSELEPLTVVKEDIWEVPHNLKELQRQDESPKELFSKATEVQAQTRQKLFWENFTLCNRACYISNLRGAALSS